MRLVRLEPEPLGEVAQGWCPAAGAGRGHGRGFPNGCCWQGVCQAGRAGRRGGRPWAPGSPGHGTQGPGTVAVLQPVGPPWPTPKAGGRRKVIPGRKAYDRGRKQCALETSRSSPGPEPDFLLTVRAAGLQEVGWPLRPAEWQGRRMSPSAPSPRGTPAGP